MPGSWGSGEGGLLQIQGQPSTCQPGATKLRSCLKQTKKIH